MEYDELEICDVEENETLPCWYHAAVIFLFF